MTIDDERELRRQLGGALEAITPSPAPVAATVRKGKTMRTRRRIGVAAGLAAAIGIALAVPGLVHQVVGQPSVTRHEHRWVLTVHPPGPRPSPGLIAWGTINGSRWQIAMVNAGQAGLCLELDGRSQWASCQGASLDPVADPVDFQGSVDNNNGVSYRYGEVRRDVARVVIALANGTSLTLHPVPLYGQRWVAFATPSDLAIARVTAYSARAELGFAIPYGDATATWLRPSEQGLPRATYLIASGVLNGAAWSDVVHVGPWGYCTTVTLPGGGGVACVSAQSRMVTGNSYYFSSSLGTSSSGAIIEGNASPPVAYVVGILSDGRTVRARAVDAGGPRFWAWAVPRGQRLRRVVFYSASGHQVAVQSGAEYNKGL